jgi:hypothetical protein
MKKRNWSFNYAIVWLVALAAIAIVLACFEGHLLWKAQQMSLFLPTSLFFKEQMVVAGGWLTWMASFLTQFLYWKWVGLVLLCGCWWLMMWLTKRAFRIPGQWAALLLIPVALLLLTIVFRTMYHCINHGNKTQQTNQRSHLSAAHAKDVWLVSSFRRTWSAHQQKTYDDHCHAYCKQYVVHATKCKILILHYINS